MQPPYYPPEQLALSGARHELLASIEAITGWRLSGETVEMGLLALARYAARLEQRIVALERQAAMSASPEGTGDA